MVLSQATRASGHPPDVCISGLLSVSVNGLRLWQIVLLCPKNCDRCCPPLWAKHHLNLFIGGKTSLLALTVFGETAPGFLSAPGERHLVPSRGFALESPRGNRLLARRLLLVSGPEDVPTRSEGLFTEPPESGEEPE